MKILFLENWIQNKCFWKAFHLILMHFIHKILYFKEFLHKIALFFKKLVFLKFQSIKPVSRLIEIAIKVLVWLYVFRSMLDCLWINWRYFRSIESNFRSIENLIESFLKPLFLMCSSLFKTFSKHLSLSLQSVKESKQIFVMHLGLFLNLRKIGIFDDSSFFFGN